MCKPIRSGSAEAVAGGVRLARHLERPWMTPLHRTWLASTELIDPARPGEMVGANMAFSRTVLERVGAFDPDLGPGALGCGEESLFSRQILKAGYRIAGALDVAVEHHCSADRLHRAAFLGRAAWHGRSWAYLMYHWEHQVLNRMEIWRRMAKLVAKLGLLRARNRQSWDQDGALPREMELVRDIHFCRQWLRESRRPRLYDKHGLVKRNPEPHADCIFASLAK
jgi:GT2 family glycosyltransferase